MKLGILFSGGKDSCYAAYLASKKHEVTCLISLHPDNKESYMFHTPNIEWTKHQAQAMGIPLVVQKTKGEKEKELADLEKAIVKAQKKYGITGIVTGAIDSVYQAVRVQRVCSKLGLWCFNPLWKREQVGYLKELTHEGFTTLISGVFAFPFDDSWLGREIDKAAIEELTQLQQKYKINPSGEGGEIETFVIDGPLFKKRIEITDVEYSFENHSGLYTIKQLRLVNK